MARIFSFLSLLSVALAMDERANHLRAGRQNDTMSPSGLLASATFLGFNVTVPRGTVLNLTFVPNFGPSTAEVASEYDAVMVPVVFSAAGRDEVALSTCGTYDAATNVFRGRTICTRNVVVNEIEKRPDVFVTAGNIVTTTPLVTANLSGQAVSFSGVSIFEKQQGFFFSVLSTASTPVTLTHIKVTGKDLKDMVPLPDVDLAAAVPALISA